MRRMRMHTWNYFNSWRIRLPWTSALVHAAENDYAYIPTYSQFYDAASSLENRWKQIPIDEYVHCTLIYTWIHFHIYPDTTDTFRSNTFSCCLDSNRKGKANFLWMSLFQSNCYQTVATSFASPEVCLHRRFIAYELTTISLFNCLLSISLHCLLMYYYLNFKNKKARVNLFSCCVVFRVSTIYWFSVLCIELWKTTFSLILK